MRGQYLNSYAFMGNNLRRWLQRYGADNDVMIDSGAHSVHNSGAEIDLDEYCTWIEENKERITRFVQLDVIGNKAATMHNLKLMRERGLDPMPVLTADAHERDALELLRGADKPQLCVAGGAGLTSGARAKMENGLTWYQNRVHLLRRTVGKDVWLHGLGFTKTTHEMAALPLNSFDSSSHTHASRTGMLYVWDHRRLRVQGGYLRYGTAKCQVSSQGCYDFRFWNRVEPWARDTVMRLGITPEMLAKLSGHRGHWTLTNALSHWSWCQAAHMMINNTGQVLYLANNYMQQMLTQPIFDETPGWPDMPPLVEAARARYDSWKKRPKEGVR